MYKGGIYDHFGGGFGAVFRPTASGSRRILKRRCTTTRCLRYAIPRRGRTAAWHCTVRSRRRRWITACASSRGQRRILLRAGRGQRRRGGCALSLPPQPRSKSRSARTTGGTSASATTSPMGAISTGRVSRISLLNTRWNFVPEGYAEFRERLRDYRAEQTPLAADTKLLASWNGLMLMALSRAARAFDSDRVSRRRRKAGGVHALRLRPRRGYARLRIRRETRFPAPP